MKRVVKVEDAIGLSLAHDLTRIVPGEFKGRAFKKGHVIREEDIPLLLDIGKRNIYVLELATHEMHEEDAARVMASNIAGEGIIHSDVHEGKVVLKARHSGMLFVDEPSVYAMNRIEDISITTRHPWIHVTEGTSIAGVRPIPLVIETAKVDEVVRLAEESRGTRPSYATGVVDVIPYMSHQVFVVTTGSEIATGRIEDKFGPALTNKFAIYGAKVIGQAFPGDEVDDIVSSIQSGILQGATMVCVTGGMSVDPDDCSPLAIRRSSTEVVTYGTPMLPGSMMMLAYQHNIPIFGLPGAVIYDAKTSFDVLLPRVLAGVRLKKEDIAKHGVGGWLSV